MVTITIFDIEKALQNTLGKKGMEKEQIRRLAAYIMNFFGFSDSISDNLLKAKERDVFYILQDVGILTTYQDQISIKKGRIWRIHYWVLKKRDILRLANQKPDNDRGNEYTKIYNELPTDVWRSRN